MVFGASVPCIFARDHLRQVVIHCLGLISDLSPMVQGPGQGQVQKPLAPWGLPVCQRSAAAPVDAEVLLRSADSFISNSRGL